VMALQRAHGRQLSCRKMQLTTKGRLGVGQGSKIGVCRLPIELFPAHKWESGCWEGLDTRVMESPGVDV